MEAPPALGPFFFQMLVSPKIDNERYGEINGCFATLIIFAHNGEKARERAGKYLANEKWEITELKRMQLLSAENISNMNPVLKGVYQKAENIGIGSQFDTW